MKIKNTYLIDQSGKIEQTQVDTVIAYSNGRKRAIKIPRRLKRKVQEVFRLHGMTSFFIYFLFSTGIFYLIGNLKEKRDIIIDTEYPGKDKIILSILNSLLTKSQRPRHIINFARIGNKPNAHYAAKDVYDKKKKPDFILTEKRVVEALKKTDGRLRECLSTLVGAQAQPYGLKIPRKSKKVK